MSGKPKGNGLYIRTVVGAIKRPYIFICIINIQTHVCIICDACVYMYVYLFIYLFRRM